MNEAHKAAEEDVIVIDFAQLAKALWQRFWIVIVVTLMGCSLTYLGTKAFVQPTYRATFTAYVNNKSSSEGATTVTNSDLTAAQSLVYTYTHILTSRTMLTAAAAQVGENYSYDEMSEWVTTNVIDDTEIIEVCVTMDSAEGALTLAEAIAEIMPDYVTQIVEGSSVQIIDMPVLPDSIYSPSYLRNAAIGGVIGAFLTAMLILLQGLLDDTVKDEETLEKRFGVAVIGVIPDLETAGKQSTHYGVYGHKKTDQSTAGKRVVNKK